MAEQAANAANAGWVFPSTAKCGHLEQGTGKTQHSAALAKANGETLKANAVSRFPALGSTGHCFDGRLDSPSRREALADTASWHLFCGDCRRDSFLLESKIRRALAALLRRARCNPALVEIE